ncbi:MAG TPA: type II toxin-antitoxin system VapC family toxin [Kofleriaceae bacterium]|nr:type II toxin-antitoxin system VapC family toxin [Kofleriaceae bacterium]
MRWLLDSDVCIAFLNGADAGVRDRLLAARPDELRLCAVVKAELLYGARHSAKVVDNLRKLERFFAPFESLPFDDDAAEWYGTIRAQLRREGSPIGGNDLLIAAIARAADVTLVTRNQQEFRRIPGLRVETW